MKTIFKAALAMFFCAFMCLLSTSCSKEEEMGQGDSSGRGTSYFVSKTIADTPQNTATSNQK